MKRQVLPTTEAAITNTELAVVADCGNRCYINMDANNISRRHQIVLWTFAFCGCRGLGQGKWRIDVTGIGQLYVYLRCIYYCIICV